MTSDAASRPPRFPITRLWLVCCGELEDSSFMPDFTGHSDPGLSPLGIRQAEAIGADLATSVTPPVAALYASPLRSAQITATHIAAALRLGDIDPQGALATVMPEQLPPGRDGIATFSMIEERAWALVETLKQRHQPDVSVVLVSHELPIKAIISHALGLPSLEETHRFLVQPGSISAIEFRGPRTLLHVLNHIPHLP